MNKFYDLYENEKPDEHFISQNFFYPPTNEYYNQEDNYNANEIVYYKGNNEIDKSEKTKAKTNEEEMNKSVIIDLNIDDSNKNDFNLNNNPTKCDCEKIINEKKKCGRKRKRNDENKTGEHNKFSDDNIRRKCKHLVINNTLKFINNQIIKIYNGNIGNGIFKKELQTINQSQKSDATINFNKIFLTKKLGEIFSDPISGRFTNFPPNHNKNLIEKLMNEEDENKRIYFNNLFNLTFTQCLQHFRGEIYINELDGLKCFNQVKNDILNKYVEDGEEYIDSLCYYLNNFEEIINNKRARKSRKKKNENENE
jgi:hypothetical protein